MYPQAGVSCTGLSVGSAHSQGCLFYICVSPAEIKWGKDSKNFFSIICYQIPPILAQKFIFLVESSSLPISLTLHLSTVIKSLKDPDLLQKATPHPQFKFLLGFSVMSFLSPGISDYARTVRNSPESLGDK